MLKRAGLTDAGDFSPHSMRHSFATLHILAGKPAKWVSEQLGHKDVTITLKIYAKWFRQVAVGAADDLGATLFGEPDGILPPRDGTLVAPYHPHAPENPAPMLH